jgi:hypothetical protein
MREISQPSQLTQYGIVALTGEVCQLQKRLLCDLTEEGAQVVASFLGLPTACFARSANSGHWSTVDGESVRVDHVASVTLPLACMNDLGIFAALWHGGIAVIEQEAGFLVAESDDDLDKLGIDRGDRFVSPESRYSLLRGKRIFWDTYDAHGTWFGSVSIWTPPRGKESIQ